MSGSESSDDDANIPPAAECDIRCKSFAAITDTDSACAQFFLQDVEWDLQRALDAYFEQTGINKAPSGNTQTESTASSTGGKSTCVTKDPEPHRIRLLTWNTDGIDTNNVQTRARAVCKIILQEKPDVVFLQEVVLNSLQVYEKECPQYQMVCPDTSKGYFCVVLLRAESVVLKDHTVIPFSSVMARNLMHVKNPSGSRLTFREGNLESVSWVSFSPEQVPPVLHLQDSATVKGIEMDLMTTHLESMANHSSERQLQLKKAFEEVGTAPGGSTVVFGGDLNLRDKELAALGGIPDGLVDLWEVTGKRPEAKFTWDTQKNDNLDMGLKYKPRCRFDRLYLRQPKTLPRTLKPVYFELVGIQRLESCKRFPSDHWGLLAHFNKVNTPAPQS